jgi:hypothetical protein
MAGVCKGIEIALEVGVIVPILHGQGGHGCGLP